MTSSYHRQRIGLLGGTFDPPHIAHLLLAERAREQLALERVLWVPAGAPWRKAERPVSGARHRAAMVERAIADNHAFELSTVELKREGPSYTVETLDQLAAESPEVEWVLLLGQDALGELPNWREPERIVKLATLAVAGRVRDEANSGELEHGPGARGTESITIDMPRLEISGTEIRARVAAGRSIRYLVPDAVREYIEEQGLYRRS